MKKLKVFLAVGLLCCGLSMSMAEAKTMTLDKTKVLAVSYTHLTLPTIRLV